MNAQYNKLCLNVINRGALMYSSYFRTLSYYKLNDIKINRISQISFGKIRKNKQRYVQVQLSSFNCNERLHDSISCTSFRSQNLFLQHGGHAFSCFLRKLRKLTETSGRSRPLYVGDALKALLRFSIFMQCTHIHPV